MAEQKLDSITTSESFDTYGKHIADRLRQMKPGQVKFVQKLISDVLFEGEMESLNANCKLTVTGQRDQQPLISSVGETYPPHYGNNLASVLATTITSFAPTWHAKTCTSTWYARLSATRTSTCRNRNASYHFFIGRLRHNFFIQIPNWSFSKNVIFLMFKVVSYVQIFLSFFVLKLKNFFVNVYLFTTNKQIHLRRQI